MSTLLEDAWSDSWAGMQDALGKSATYIPQGNTDNQETVTVVPRLRQVNYAGDGPEGDKEVVEIDVLVDNGDIASPARGDKLTLDEETYVVLDVDHETTGAVVLHCKNDTPIHRAGTVRRRG
jgi:hypothetical protein